MSEARFPPGTRPPDPDEDRLLTYILGLESDPELEAAAADDEVLRRRIDSLRVELAHVAQTVKLAVPLPEPDYADLRNPRWDLLSEAIATDARSTGDPKAVALAPAGGRRQPPRSLWSRRWFRLLTPAVAALIVLAVGVSVLQNQRTLRSVAEQGAGTKATMDTATAPGSAGEENGTPQATTEASTAPLDIVLVARARVAHNGMQRFDTVRVLQGEAPATLRLVVTTRPAVAGQLHVLFIRVSAETGTHPGAAENVAAEAQTAPLRLLLTQRDDTAERPQDEVASVSPSASSSAPPDEAPREPAVTELVVADSDRIVFENDGDVFAVQLPSGVRADEVALP